MVVVVEAFLVEDVVLFRGSAVVVLPSMAIVGEEVLLEVSGEGDEGHLPYPYHLRVLFAHKQVVLFHNHFIVPELNVSERIWI